MRPGRAALVGLAGVCAVAALARWCPEPTLRAVVAVLFALLGPGVALVPLMRLPDPGLRFVFVPLIGLLSSTALALALSTLHLWSADAAIGGLAVVCGVGAVFSSLDRPADRSAAVRDR